MRVKIFPAVSSDHGEVLGRLTWIASTYVGFCVEITPMTEAFVRHAPFWYFPLNAICAVPVFAPNVYHGFRSFFDHQWERTLSKAVLISILVFSLNILLTTFGGISWIFHLPSLIQ